MSRLWLEITCNWIIIFQRDISSVKFCIMVAFFASLSFKITCYQYNSILEISHFFLDPWWQLKSSIHNCQVFFDCHSVNSRFSGINFDFDFFINFTSLIFISKARIDGKVEPMFIVILKHQNFETLLLFFFMITHHFLNIISFDF